MMWIVRFKTIEEDDQCPYESCLYLPREHDDLSFKLKLPVTISFAATFKTKKQAKLAIMKAMSRDFPIDVHSMAYEKYYRRSFPPKKV